jgi:SNF2 family DNA or RNA helicase
MIKTDLKPGVTVTGTIFPEPVQIITSFDVGNATKIIGKGLNSNQVREAILSDMQLQNLVVSPEKTPFSGNAKNFRLGIEALRLGLAYEYDPYFSLSIARVDPLPHQLEAVYEYFLRLPRIRFLLADDPGAGKTIMAGLLLKELKIRGLVKRTLIVAPANLCFQWQREMKDKFHEPFNVIRGDVLRSNYGQNPWQEFNQAVTSVSWISRVEDANESLLRSEWDLIIVDEAHKMAAYNRENKTLAYRLGEELSKRTDHYLLMTATPHKGDPTNFCLFLELLDRDVYGDVKSLEEAMCRNSAPFYIRRTKEALVTFPDPETGISRRIFTDRKVQTVQFEIDSEEADFYLALTRYVEDQSIKAKSEDSARGRALGFTMAMLQRRFASSVYAVRRSLERMRDRRQKMLDDPGAYRQEQLTKKIPEDYYDLSDEEQQEILEELEQVVASIDPSALRDEISQLNRLIDQALILEEREVETKLTKLREVITQEGVFKDPEMKLLIFTEHKDTLDYLVGKLRDWNLAVTQIHGGMKIGDRDKYGTRIHAEREFKESAQILVATEAAGEGINLQFCWFMINYDIPWNPIRLEQRMGRIHRYGQEKDCLILNFVSINTREGRVLQKLFDRLAVIEKELDPQRTGKVFNVLGDVFPTNQLERMIRDMYSRSLTEEAIKNRIVQEIDVDRIKCITESTLEGLAKRELNLSPLIGKQAEAKERRLVPEVVEDFFTLAAPMTGIRLTESKSNPHQYTLGKVSKSLWGIGDQLEPQFGRLGREYKQVIFDKNLLVKSPTSEWVTPGHPLFEAVREYINRHVRFDLQKGAVFFDLHSKNSYRLDFFAASIIDGRGHILHKRLFAAQVNVDGGIKIKQPTILLDLVLTDTTVKTPADSNLPGWNETEKELIEHTLIPFLTKITSDREREVGTIRKHIDLSLNVLIDRQNLRYAELMEQQNKGDTSPLISANIKQVEDRIDELNARLESRLSELEHEKQCSIGEIQRIGQAWVLPHPERNVPEISKLVRDEEIERIAVNEAIRYEESQGWIVESVETENKGFDLISRKPDPRFPGSFIDVRFIEVKGRALVGDVALTSNEYKTSQRLGNDYWLYVVYNCASTPNLIRIPNPGRLDWNPVLKIEHYTLKAEKIKGAENE